MSLSLRQLRYFVALAETLHFGKAATRCFVTQSTLSAGIKELEESLGARLAERTKRRVVLTPLGQEVAVRARALLRDAEEIKALTASYRQPLSGALRFGVIPTIAPYLLPRALPDIRAAHPDLDLILIEDQTERLLQSLREGRLDVVLMALPWPSDEFTSFTLFADPFQLACPKDHRLAKCKQVCSDDFADEPLLLLADGHCLREHALNACSFKGRRGQRGMEGTSLLTLAQMVAGGLGITLLPQMAIDAGLARLSNLALVPLEPNSNARDIGLLWRKTSGRDEEFKQLGAFFDPVSAT
ncbi:MAG: hydrogen peroxide-inducible genes activator [Robiginitomaculum sp.]|nr:hydrogen peroxide-inducible genes activator [Robiginitomaculum sp.]MDQ7078346.1 hydrogen peroxide-inducible genes activator [Robiginitomaculum sp.]